MKNIKKENRNIFLPTNSSVLNRLQQNENYTTFFLEGVIKVMKARTSIYMSSIKFVKDRIGKQDYCINLSRRCWIWERPGKLLIIASVCGISYETFETDPIKIVKSLDQFWYDLGV